VLRVPEGYTSTPDSDPVRILQDVPVALDASRLMNSGAPTLVMQLIEALGLRPGHTVAHLGCGTGYYSAILAEIVGLSGHVLAMEIDPELATRAKRNLRGWKQVECVQADASRRDLPPCDAILVSAGATHPRAGWLDRLRPDGGLVVPLTGLRPPPPAARFGRNLAGRALLVRNASDGWHARFLARVGLSPLLGGRDVAHERLLAEALSRSGEQSEQVRSLRRDAHARDASCWLHASDFCLSRALPGVE
jgi:protein-L-isoaspartate(D-aspartate) O-methyltransferase